MNIVLRVFAIVPSEFLENFWKRGNELLNSEEGEKVKRLLAIDGKTQRGNGNKKYVYKKGYDNDSAYTK